MSLTKSLIKNAARCRKCLSYLESKHRHDFVRCECGSIFIDGGLDYRRGGWPGGDINEWVEDLSEYRPENGQEG